MSPDAALCARLARHLTTVVQFVDRRGAPVVPVVGMGANVLVVYLPRGARVVRGVCPTAVDGLRVRLVRTGKVGPA